MPAPSTVSKHSDLLNRLVLERNTMEEIGRIEVLWMYPDAHRVLGFVCKSGILGAQKRAFNLAQIHTLGTDSILVNSGPTETDANRVKQLESLVHCEVWSEAGKKVGRIVDYTFDLRTGAIQSYLLQLADGWTAVLGAIYQLPPRKILSFGNRRVLVAEAAIPTLKIYREGLQQRVTGAGEFLKEHYTEATQGLHQWTEQAQSLKKQAQGRFATWADRAKQKAQQLAQQAQERAHLLSEQFQEETQQLSERARETGSSVLGRMQEEARDLGQTFNEEVKGWSEQAKDQWDELREELHHPSQQQDRPPSRAETSMPETDVDDWGDWDDWDEERDLDASSPSQSPNPASATQDETARQEQTAGSSKQNVTPPAAEQWDDDDWEDDWGMSAQPAQNQTVANPAQNPLVKEAGAETGILDRQHQNRTDATADRQSSQVVAGSSLPASEGTAEMVEASPAIAASPLDLSPTGSEDSALQPETTSVTTVEVAPNLVESTPEKVLAGNEEVLKSAEVSRTDSDRALSPSKSASNSTLQSGLAESWPENFDDEWINEPAAAIDPSVIPEEDLEDDDPWV